MNRNQCRQRTINQLGFKHSHCGTHQSPQTNPGRGKQQRNWLQLRNQRREQHRELFGKNQAGTGENYG